MSTVKGPLKYRFIAEFKDGSTYEQNEEDKAITKETGSAFSDIADRLDELKTFHLLSESNTVSVNLITGQFCIDGLTFDAADQSFVPTAPLKLIYFREVQRHIKVRAHVDDNMNVQEDEHEFGEPFINRYFVGWETVDKEGNKVQRTIAVK